MKLSLNLKPLELKCFSSLSVPILLMESVYSYGEIHRAWGCRSLNCIAFVCVGCLLFSLEKKIYNWTKYCQDASLVFTPIRLMN